MAVIYKITNKENNKVYIGQTIQKPELRWYHHLEEASLGSNLKFHRALRKYGKDSFNWEIIETVEPEKLNEREKYWISFYDSYKNGYNSTLGGDKPPRNDIQIICLETNKIYQSAAEASRETGINACHISECAREAESRVTAGGFHWMNYEKYKEKGPIYKQTGNEQSSVSVLCEETGIIYDSILAASKATGIARKTIKNICEGITKNPKKYHWRYNNK